MHVVWDNWPSVPPDRRSSYQHAPIQSHARAVSLDMPHSVSLARRIVSWLAFALAGASAFLAMWIVVPAPTRLLLPLAVGAPEVSAWILAGSVFALLLALPTVRQRWVSRAATVLALVSGGLSASPLLRFAAVADDANQQLALALGGDYLERIPSSVRDHFRPQPLLVRDLFRGLSSAPVVTRVTSGVRFAATGTQPLVLNVYQPDNDTLHPVLVQIYGGAWQRGSPDDNGEFAAYFAAQGYVVFAIDYRHAPQFVFPTQIDDVRTALAWIGEHSAEYHADTSRLALIGRSAGAHLAMLAAYAPDAPRVRAVIDFYGPVDLVEGYRKPPVPDPLAVRPIEEAFIGGTPAQMEARYRAASPISLVTRKLPPTLLLYGGRDHIVEPRFGTLLAGRLRAEGGTVVHVEIPWAEHAFDAVPQGPSSQLSRYVIERFLASFMTR